MNSGNLIKKVVLCCSADERLLKRRFNDWYRRLLWNQSFFSFWSLSRICQFNQVKKYLWRPAVTTYKWQKELTEFIGLKQKNPNDA